MVDFNGWLQAESYTDEVADAVASWNSILDFPFSIVIKRGVTKLAAQTVRVSVLDSSELPQGSSAQLGTMGVQSVTVFGVRNHPTISDTDIKRGDRFILGGKEYEIDVVNELRGKVQATGTVKK